MRSPSQSPASSPSPAATASAAPASRPFLTPSQFASNPCPLQYLRVEIMESRTELRCAACPKHLAQAEISTILKVLGP